MVAQRRHARSTATRMLLHWTLAGNLLLLLGCGGNQRQPLTGLVTLDGQPLSEGSITFMPQAGTASPSAGASITDGRFSISAEKGLLPGVFRVEITAKRKTGRQVQSDTAGMVDQYEQFLPARYNRDSQLTAQIQQGANQFDFAMKALTPSPHGP